MIEQREIASKMLSQLGCKVDSVDSGEEAIQYIRSKPADLIVLDMIMAPGIDGLDTFEQINRLNPRQKAIITSRFSETRRVKEAQNLGAGEYVKKAIFGGKDRSGRPKRTGTTERILLPAMMQRNV